MKVRMRKPSNYKQPSRPRELAARPVGDQLENATKVGNYAWSVVDFGTGSKVQTMRNLVTDLKHYRKGWNPQQVTRIFCATAKAQYKDNAFSKITAKRLFDVSTREFDPKSACMFLNSLAELRTAEPTLCESIACKLFGVDSKLQIGHETDKIAMAVALESLGYPRAIHLVKRKLPSSIRQWVKLGTEKGIVSMLMSFMRTQHITPVPTYLVHHSLIRLMELDTVRLLSLKTLGLSAFAIAKMKDGVEDRQFAILSLGKKMLDHYTKRTSVKLYPLPLLNMIFAHGKLSLSLDLASDLVDLLNEIPDRLPFLPTDLKVKTLWAISHMFSHRLSHEPLSSKHQHIVDEFIAHLTSLEETERLKSGQICKIYYSFVKLKYENAFQIECLGSTLRENPRLIESMNASAIVDLVLSMSKLRLFSEVDIVTCAMKRFCAISDSETSHVLTGNLFQALGVFAPVLSAPERLSLGKVLVKRISHNENPIRVDSVCKMVWGVSRLQLEIGPALLKRLTCFLEQDSVELNSYQKSQIDQWKSYRDSNLPRPQIIKQTDQENKASLTMPPVGNQLEFKGERYLKISEDKRW
eukprot:TRINITY_DN6550_c3_g1_i1.p1 TRINITY_DN6550_c3_g1~~TRINITY_DN6550_c3_g1_i1.p1  ORF type:complete len:615 (+),score=57.66 TRINITY_DN6550_c3_g1_i1:104-1846(+)